MWGDRASPMLSYPRPVWSRPELNILHSTSDPPTRPHATQSSTWAPANVDLMVEEGECTPEIKHGSWEIKKFLSSTYLWTYRSILIGHTCKRAFKKITLL